MEQIDKFVEELFRTYGGACHAAQLLEHSFRFLLISQKASEKQTLSKKHVQPIETETMRMNLRSLFEYLKNKEYFTDKEHKTIINAIRKRNYLIHECFSNNRFSGLSSEGRNNSLDEITEIREELNSAREIIESLAERYLVEFGLSVDKLVNMVELMYEDDDQDEIFSIH